MNVKGKNPRETKKDKKSESIVGKVLEVRDGSSFYYIPKENPKGKARLAILAFIAVPQINKNEQWAYEAREYLRNKIVGQEIKMKYIAGRDVDYVEARLGKTIINEEMLKLGYALILDRKKFRRIY